jgi:epoxyqueuosine reductase QueG
MLTGKYSKYSYGISIAKKLDKNIMDTVSKGPNENYLDLYNNTNTYLSELVTLISERLSKNKITSLSISPTRTASYGDKNFRNFSHKMVATRAGLGWIGKTDLFISSKFGPRIRLASVLLKDAPKDIGTPVEKSLCGACSLCVKSCPANAANGKLWDVNTDRDEFFDVYKCYDMTGELSYKNLGIDKHICGICVSVCPKGME